MSSHVNYTQTKNVVIYFQSFDDTHFALTLLSHMILTHMSWLQPRGLHFILSGKGNCDFDVKFEHCRFVNDVIDCECLGCVFVLKLRRKRKTHSISNFILQYFSKVFFFSLLQLINYNGYVCVIYNCYFLWWTHYLLGSYFLCIGFSFDKTNFTCDWVDLSWV